MSLFSSKPTAFLGVDIGADGIKLVQLNKTKGRPQLWTYGMVKEKMNVHLGAQPKNMSPRQSFGMQPAVEGKISVAPQAGLSLGDSQLHTGNQAEVERYAELLKTLVKESRVTTNVATASLPVSYIFHTVITMPKSEPAEIQRIAQAEVTKFLSRPADEMQVAHQIIPQSEIEKKQKYMRILVTAAPKSLVAFYSAIFSKAGLQLQELETEAFAEERSLVGKDKTTSMIVDIGAERTNFFIIDQGLPMTHRSIQEGGERFQEALSQILDVDPKLVGQMKKDLSRAPRGAFMSTVFDSAIDSMVKEIQYSFDVFLNQLGNEQKRPEKIILTGGACVIPIIQERLQEAFSMKVFVGDPWARVVYQQRLKPILDTVGPRMAVSIGLAMRNIVE